METNDAAAIERAWLERVGNGLGRQIGTGPVSPPSESEVRLLLRVTKITADVTGVRYLAPLTAYLIGRAGGAAGHTFDLKAVVDAIAAIAEEWIKAPPAD